MVYIVLKLYIITAIISVTRSFEKKHEEVVEFIADSRTNSLLDDILLHIRCDNVDAYTDSKFGELRSRYTRLHLLQQGNDANIYVVFDEEKKTDVILKVMLMWKINECIKREDWNKTTGVGVNLHFVPACVANLQFLPAEPFVTKVLTRLGDYTAHLHHYFFFKEAIIGLMFMDELDRGAVLLELLKYGLLELDQGRLLTRKLIQTLMKFVQFGVAHLDLHTNNIFFLGGNEVRVIDFGRVELNVQEEGEKVLQNFASMTYHQSLRKIVAASEYHYQNLEIYEDVLTNGKLRYIPSRYMVFHVGFALYASVVNSGPFRWEDIFPFYMNLTTLPMISDDLGPYLLDFLSHTLVSDYRARTPLSKLFNHVFLKKARQNRSTTTADDDRDDDDDNSPSSPTDPSSDDRRLLSKLRRKWMDRLIHNRTSRQTSAVTT